MPLRLVPNLRRVLRHSWSFRGNVVLALCSGVDAALGYAADGRIGTSAAVFLAASLSAGARCVAQEKVSGGEGEA